MKVILEGGCGRGKTTLGNELALLTAVPLYRPFRHTDHISKEQMDAMRQEIGLSINGWEEDLYVADFIANVQCSVILDRSMPSALAYNEASSNPLSFTQRQAVLELWAQRITAARATLVLLVGSETVRKKRSPTRGGQWEEDGIKQAIREAIVLGHGIGDPVTINTDNCEPDKAALALARYATWGYPHPLIEPLKLA